VARPSLADSAIFLAGCPSTERSIKSSTADRTMLLDPNLQRAHESQSIPGEHLPQ